MKIVERNIILKSCISVVFFVIFQIIKTSVPHDEQLTALTFLIVAAIIVAIFVLIKDENEARNEWENDKLKDDELERLRKIVDKSLNK
ncbi:MAG TPA: hypothetical protein VK625_03435 [Flavitalea sp.]|nr:hypothetical protein [Flavitalea sp.]